MVENCIVIEERKKQSIIGKNKVVSETNKVKLKSVKVLPNLTEKKEEKTRSENKKRGGGSKSKRDGAEKKINNETIWFSWT